MGLTGLHNESDITGLNSGPKWFVRNEPGDRRIGAVIGHPFMEFVHFWIALENPECHTDSLQHVSVHRRASSTMKCNNAIPMSRLLYFHPMAITTASKTAIS